MSETTFVADVEPSGRPMTSEERIAVLAMLDAVCETWPTTCDHTPEEYRQEFNNVIFTLPNGWRVEVFKDGYSFGDWDYIDKIHAPDGRSWEWPFGEVTDFEAEGYQIHCISNWSPSMTNEKGWAPFSSRG